MFQQTYKIEMRLTNITQVLEHKKWLKSENGILLKMIKNTIKHESHTQIVMTKIPQMRGLSYLLISNLWGG